jgi:hypothetical protein
MSILSSAIGPVVEMERGGEGGAGGDLANAGTAPGETSTRVYICPAF